MLSIVILAPRYDHSQRSPYGTLVRMGTHFSYVKRTGSSGPFDETTISNYDAFALRLSIYCCKTSVTSSGARPASSMMSLTASSSLRLFCSNSSSNSRCSDSMRMFNALINSCFAWIFSSRDFLCPLGIYCVLLS